MHIKVIVADDHTLFREGLVALLRTCPEIDVVGAVADGREVIHAAAEHQPHVVLMDLRMPHVDGVEATRQLVDQARDIKVLVLTTFDDDASIFSALNAGAVGYLLKDVSRSRLLEAIQAAARGEGPLSDRIGARVLRWLSGNERLSNANDTGLTARETEVLRLLGRGLSNKEIAAHIGLAEGTIKNHLTRVFDKLGVEDRTQAALRAAEHGLT